MPVEIHFDRISGGLTFAAVRSRAQIVGVGEEAADRPKDRAVLPILRDTMAVKQKLE